MAIVTSDIDIVYCKIEVVARDRQARTHEARLSDCFWPFSTSHGQEATGSNPMQWLLRTNANDRSDRMQKTDQVARNLHPNKSRTLPINIAPQNNSGSNVLNVIVTGNGISDPVQVIDGSRFDLDDQV